MRDRQLLLLVETTVHTKLNSEYKQRFEVTAGKTSEKGKKKRPSVSKIKDSQTGYDQEFSFHGPEEQASMKIVKVLSTVKKTSLL